MMGPVLAIALNGFRESRRNRVTLVIFAFAFVMIFASTVSFELTVSTFDRVVTDIGLGVMSLIGAGLTIFLGSGLIPREIERRTIFMVVSKPVSRSAFVVGRLAGNIMTVWFVLSVMMGLFLVQLVWTRSTVDPAHFVAFWGMLLEVLVVSSVCFVFASTSSQFVTALCTTGLYFIGHLATDLYRYATNSGSEAMKAIGTGLYFVLPNLDRLDFKPRATYFDPTTTKELIEATVYAGSYALVMVVIATVLFKRRDFR